jgi:hypothetical protein
VQDRIAMQENKMGLSAAADEPALFPFGTLSISSILISLPRSEVTPFLVEVIRER